MARDFRVFRKAAATVLVLFYASVALAANAGDQDARSAYKEAMRAYRAGKRDEAIALFQKSEELSPTYVYPAFALARIYQAIFDQEARMYEDAVICYDRVTALLRAQPPGESDKELNQSYYFQGLLYLKGGESGKAIQSLQTFLKVYKDFSSSERVYNAIGIAQYYLNHYDRAVEAFRKALELKPDFAEARFNMRSVYTRLVVYNEAAANARAGNLEVALERIAHLKVFAPRYIPGRSLEGRVLLRMGKTSEALATFREVLALEPDHPATYGVRLEMAKILEARGDSAKALELLRENLRRFPDSQDKESKEEVLRLLTRLGGAP